MHPLVAATPTPVHPLPRLAKALGLEPEQLWVKREDLTGLAGGGNKARKLAHFLSEALSGGYRVLVTGGGPQSNHARMTAAAAAMNGLGCVLVLRRPETEDLSGNLLLDRMLGARIHWVDPMPFARLNESIVEVAAASAEKAFPIPIGGSSLPGAIAYAQVAQELSTQLHFDLAVVANGSGGTQAGLAAGLGDHARVAGVNVGAQDGIDAFVTDLAAQAAEHLGLPVPNGAAQIDHGHIGQAYGVPTKECEEALLLVARTEGLILDPVYTGKAMAGLIAWARKGKLDGKRVVFVHTGGLPGLLSAQYTAWMADALGS
jgi:D-cysteine desulfhydrase